MNQRFVLTGGPGSGKTTTLESLRKLGCHCVDDAARQIIQDRVQRGLDPRPAPVQFAQDILELCFEHYDRTPDHGSPTFFDFGIVEPLLILRELGYITEADIRPQLLNRPYNSTVFFFPPWAAIYRQDSERDQVFEESVEIARRIQAGYAMLGFRLVTVPFGPPEMRAEFVLSRFQAVTS